MPFILLIFGERSQADLSDACCASDCYFKGLLGMGLGNAAQAGFRQRGLTMCCDCS